MKRTVSLLLSLLMVISIITALPVTVSAASKSDLTFELDYYGEDAYVVTDCKTSASGELVIPDTYKSKPVIRIEDSAFENCKKLTSITVGNNVKQIVGAAFLNCTKLSYILIPASVEDISEYAFLNCTNLETIKVKEKNENYSSKSGVLFNKDKTELIKYPANKASTSYTVPDTVESIGVYAFENNKIIKSVTLPDTVKYLHYYVFNNCDNLKTLKIGKGVNMEYYAYNMLGKCKSLESVIFSKNNPYHSSVNGVVFNKNKTNLVLYPTGKPGNPYKIPSSVKTIGLGAFMHCTKLKSVTIPDSVKKISNDAFYYCKALKSITVPNSVTSIGTCAFEGCEKLAEAKISNKVTELTYNMFSGCTSLSKSEIPNTVKSIQHGIFSGCKNLVSVAIGTGITNIPWKTFDGCTSLKSIIIPHNIKKIEGLAFRNCTNLKSFKIPYTVKEIGDHAFGYSLDYNTWEYKKIKGIKVYGKKGSAAQTYAKENKFEFVAVTAPGKTKLKTIKNTSDGVTLTWSEVKKAEYYEIYRKVKDGKYSLIDRTTKESYTDKTAKSGKKYYYKVKSVNAAGKADYSNVLSILFLDNPTLKTASSTKSGVKLKWSKVTGAQGYMVYRKTGSGGYSKIATVKGVSKVSYTDKSAKKGKKYTYKVKAYYSKTYSAYSSTKTITDKY